MPDRAITPGHETDGGAIQEGLGGGIASGQGAMRPHRQEGAARTNKKTAGTPCSPGCGASWVEVE